MLFPILIREYILGLFDYNPRFRFRRDRDNLNTKNMRFAYFFVNLDRYDDFLF